MEMCNYGYFFRGKNGGVFNSEATQICQLDWRFFRAGIKRSMLLIVIYLFILFCFVLFAYLLVCFCCRFSVVHEQDKGGQTIQEIKHV